MKLLGAVLILILIVFGFFCVFVGCAICWEMLTVGGANQAEVVCNLFMGVIIALCGTACFAAAPVVINEM